MATYSGVNYALSSASPPSRQDQGDVKGRVKHAYDSYVAAGALALNNVINVMKLPAGARVLEAILVSDDLGTTGTLDLGWTDNGVDGASANGLLSAVDVHTAAIQARAGGITPAVAGIFKKFSAETQLQVKVSAATTAAGTIKVGVLYVLD
jgi:hypothetical protein